MAKFLCLFLLIWGGTALRAQSIPSPAPELTIAAPAPTPAPRRGVVISGATLICKGNETILKVEGDYESFEWNTGGTDRYLRVKEAGVYEVTVRTKGGCSLTSSVNVRTVNCI